VQSSQDFRHNGLSLQRNFSISVSSLLWLSSKHHKTSEDVQHRFTHLYRESHLYRDIFLKAPLFFQDSPFRQVSFIYKTRNVYWQTFMVNLHSQTSAFNKLKWHEQQALHKKNTLFNLLHNSFMHKRVFLSLTDDKRT